MGCQWEAGLEMSECSRSLPLLAMSIDTLGFGGSFQLFAHVPLCGNGQINDRQLLTALQYNHGRHISFYVSVAFIPFVILPAEARGQFHERFLMLRHHSSLVARSSTALRRVSRAAGAPDPSQNVPVEPTKSTTQQ